jgi:hypothetical protein
MPILLAVIALLVAPLMAPPNVDPRLAEPLRLLADLHDAQGQPIGRLYARYPTSLSLTLVVRTLPSNAGGYYDPARRTVMIAESVLGEDPRIVAADLDLVTVGILPADCLEIEARGFEAQAIIGRAFWQDELPSGTGFERQLARLVARYERTGIEGIRDWLAHDQAYQAVCARPSPA